MTDEELTRVFEESTARSQRNLERLRLEMRAEHEELKTRGDRYVVVRTRWLAEQFERLMDAMTMLGEELRNR